MGSHLCFPAENGCLSVVQDVHPAAAGLSYTETIPSMAPATPDGIERPLYETVVECEA